MPNKSLGIGLSPGSSRKLVLKTEAGVRSQKISLRYGVRNEPRVQVDQDSRNR